jgi:hypothetical protein
MRLTTGSDWSVFTSNGRLRTAPGNLLEVYTPDGTLNPHKVTSLSTFLSTGQRRGVK